MPGCLHLFWLSCFSYFIINYLLFKQTADRFQIQQGWSHKKAGTMSIPQDPLDKGTAINKSCLYAQRLKALTHTKLDCPSAVKKIVQIFLWR